MGPDLQERFRGLLLGTAAGDAVGLPAEGISRRRNARLYRGAWHHRLIARHGMLSDDTEHTIFVCQALLAHASSVEAFQRQLGWSLRWWFMALPAGIGLGTARAILRLWCGYGPSRSGIMTAGNGPAMRVAIVGAYFADDPEALEAFVEACTRITHTDPRALTGARAIARLAAWIVREDIRAQPGADAFLALLAGCGDDAEWRHLVVTFQQALQSDLSVRAFADSLGLSRGVSGYIYHTVPVVLYAWYRHCGDVEMTLRAIYDLGGDADTTGAIVGALAGLTAGESAIPKEWIDGIIDWPRGVPLLRKLADALAARHGAPQDATAVHYFWPAVPIRNAFFLIVVLAHGFRRLLPPY